MIHQVGALEPADIKYRRRTDRARVMHACLGFTADANLRFMVSSLGLDSVAKVSLACC